MLSITIGPFSGSSNLPPVAAPMPGLPYEIATKGSLQKKKQDIS